MPASTTEVELHQVSKCFGSTQAVSGVSITVGAGEFVTLLGPSGCGKTTILRLIGGFEFPDSGSVLLRGVDVTGLPPYRREVCTVFQQYALFPHLSVFENVAFGLRRRGTPKVGILEKVHRALHRVRLMGKESRYPSSLSGGEQQRVALARALVLEPKVLLLDEPLGALDLKLRRQMQSELKQLQRETGIAFIFVTHDQEEALSMSDRVVILFGGQVLQMGTPEELYHRPSTRFVADFLGEANILLGRAVGSEGGFTRISSSGTTLAVPTTREYRPDEEILLAVRPERIAIFTQAGEGRVSCRLEERTFHGESVSYRVRTTDGTCIQVRTSDRAAAELPLKEAELVFIDLAGAAPVVVHNDKH